MVTEDGRSLGGRGTSSDIRAGASAWIEVDGVYFVITGKKDIKKFKWKALRACIPSACLCGLETMTLTECV